MNTKKNMKRVVLVTSFIPCLILLVFFLVNKIQGPCSVTQIDFSKTPPVTNVIKYCDKLVTDFAPQVMWQFIAFLSFFLLPLFLLSILTYRMKDEVFRVWWNFARWWVPVIIGVTLFVQNAGGGGGWGMNGGAFDAFFIGIFYFIFIVVSLVKIVRAYVMTK